MHNSAAVAAEGEDGTVLFSFEPELSNRQLGNGLTVLSAGQQYVTHLKLSNLAKGAASSQLTYRLWDDAASSSKAASTLASNTNHSDQDLHDQGAGTSYGDDSTAHPSDADTSLPHKQTHTRHSSNGSTNEALSLLLGIPPSSVNHQQADVPEYSFAATQGSVPGPSSSAQQPPLLQKPMRPAVSEQPPAQVHTESRFEKKEERWVPVYLWHESGLPKKADLRDFPYEYTDTSEDTVTSSDVPAPIADPSIQLRQHQV